MNAAPATLRANFDPPPLRGYSWAFALALLAHALLVLALAWGLNWKKEAQDQAVDAELWSATAQIAAPRAANVPPPPPPKPVAKPTRPVPVPKPDKPIVQPPPQPDNSTRDAELALEQKKQEAQRKEAQRKADEARALAAAQAEQKRQGEIKAAARAKAAQEAAAKVEAAKEKAAEQQKLAEQKAAAEKVAQQKAVAARQAELLRLTALASADANTTSGSGQTPGGNASRDAGFSADYKSKVVAAIKKHINFDTFNIDGNPSVTIYFQAAPDGTITYSKVSQSSGVPAWDNAALLAVDKTRVLPRNTDGRVPSDGHIEIKPKDY